MATRKSNGGRSKSRKFEAEPLRKVVASNMGLCVYIRELADGDEAPNGRPEVMTPEAAEDTRAAFHADYKKIREVLEEAGYGVLFYQNHDPVVLMSDGTLPGKTRKAAKPAEDKPEPVEETAEPVESDGWDFEGYDDAAIKELAAEWEVAVPKGRGWRKRLEKSLAAAFDAAS